MKKTSLMLAVGALLYGTSVTYTMASISFNKINDILNQLPVVETPDLDENDNSLDLPTGTEPFTLPSNVTVDNSNPVYRYSVCTVNVGKQFASFQVDGSQMAEFPVTVVFGDGTSETVKWEAVPPPDLMKGVARGIKKEWFLAEQGDTWYLNDPWILYTATGVSIKQILLEPINRYQRATDWMSYAFDIGGKERYTKGDPQHTPDSSNGRVILIKRPPSPDVKFKAIYSEPVFISPDVGGHLPAADNIGDGDPNNDTPHDLYGKLQINFVDNAGNPIAIGGTTAIGIPDFAYIADTDCLAVEEAVFNDYQNGELSLTLTGEGNIFIMQKCGVVESRVTKLFSIELKDGGQELRTPLTLQNGCFYKVVNVNYDGTKRTVPLKGISINDKNEYYHNAK